MKIGHVFVGLLTIVAVCVAFAGCNPNSYGGGGGGGGNPTPTPPIPAGDYYVNAGIGPINEVFGFSTAPVAGGGQPSGLLNQPYMTGADGTGGAPFGIALSPNGKYLYIVNAAANSVTGFPVNADGSLGASLGAVSTAGTGASGICVDPFSQFVVVANNVSNTIESFTIGVTGALTAVSSGATKLTSPVACAFSSDGKTVYVSNSMIGTGVTAYAVSALGTLTLVNAFPLNSDNFQGIIATSSAVFAATQGGNGVGVFLTAPGGNLIPQAVTPTALAPIGIALSPNGKYLYVASAAAQGVDVFSVNTIALSHLAGPYQVFTNGLSYVSVNSAGNMLVALSVVDHAVSIFAITGTGTLGFAPQAEYVFGSSSSAKAIVAR